MDEETVRVRARWMRKLLGAVNTSHSLQSSLLYKSKRDFCTKLAILEHIPSADKSDPSCSSSGLGAMCMGG